MTMEANAPITPDTPATLGDLNAMAEAIMVEMHAVEARLTERMDRMEARLDGIEQALVEIKDLLAR